jgi:thymidine kinase
MHQYKGKLTVHTGSMFSGKTSALQKDVKKLRIAGYRVLVCKPKIDTRYGSNKVVTHDQGALDAFEIEEIGDADQYIKAFKPDFIAIDEVQFLKGPITNTVDVVKMLLNNGIGVLVAGLDIDYTGTPFGITKELSIIAEYPTKHHAVCVKCGNDAWISHRKSKSTKRIQLGNEEDYEPLCRQCHNDSEPITE